MSLLPPLLAAGLAPHKGTFLIVRRALHDQLGGFDPTVRVAEAQQDFDMFVSGSQVGLTTQTGHPAAVVPYDFSVRNPNSDSPTEIPLTTTLIGDLFADDKILSVARACQTGTDWHLRRPEIG